MTVSPFVTSGQESGLDDRTYIRRFRELIGDIPKAADEQGSGLGNALRYNMQTVPVNDDNYLSITVDGVAQQIVTSPQPSAGEVFVDFDTGRMIYGTPPATGTNNITILKNTVRWRDSTIKEALMDGVRNMYPKIFRLVQDTSITIATLVWDYELPSIFNDHFVRVTSVGLREIPASSNRFIPINAWEVIPGPTPTLRLPTSQGFSPGATIQITYEAPLASLSEVPPKAQALPLWYAAGMLLGFKEATRVRTDTQNVAAEAQANPVGSQQNAGVFFMRQFQTGLSQMSRVRSAAAPHTTYSR